MLGETFTEGCSAVQRLKPNCGEQLVYIAAFAVTADIVFGDRPKHETYARLLNAASPADLDHAFGVQVIASPNISSFPPPKTALNPMSRLCKSSSHSVSAESSASVHSGTRVRADALRSLADCLVEIASVGMTLQSFLLDTFAPSNNTCQSVQIESFNTIK